jgi:hypothetical protein
MIRQYLFIGHSPHRQLDSAYARVFPYVFPESESPNRGLASLFCYAAWEVPFLFLWADCYNRLGPSRLC